MNNIVRNLYRNVHQEHQHQIRSLFNHNCKKLRRICSSLVPVPAPIIAATPNSSTNRTIITRLYGSSSSSNAAVKSAKVVSTDIEDYRRAFLEDQVKDDGVPPVEQLIAADESFQTPDYFHVHNMFTVKDLFDARVHMGHKIGSMNINMRPFIFGNRFDMLMIDLDLTAFHLRQALNFAAHVAFRQGIIMFVSRSPQTLHLVEKTAIDCGEYSHTREWHTHILTNSMKKYGGVTRLPDLIIFLNTLDTVLGTHGAVKDAAKMLIPTVGIVDSNCDPRLITYPVPGNDDTQCAIELYCKLFKEAIMRGKSKRVLLNNRAKSSKEK